jgi:hypothetical protein
VLARGDESIIMTIAVLQPSMPILITQLHAEARCHRFT